MDPRPRHHQRHPVATFRDRVRVLRATRADRAAASCGHLRVASGLESFMSSYSRVVLFCVSLLVVPFLWNVVEGLGGSIAAAVICTVIVAAAALYANAGNPKPPAGARPA
jgi:hypothetical protein